MSSGWNGIPIKNVGKTRRKLAELLEHLTGWLVEPHEIMRTNPCNQHWEGCCAWDVWATVPGRNGQPPHPAHIYSWYRMKDCVKFGVVKVDAEFATGGPEAFDIEVCANVGK